MKNKSNYNYISLFSGCGGFDYGFKNNDFRCLGAFDIDPNVISVFKNNIAGPAYIHDLTTKELPNRIINSVDVVISGSPCQGFSTIGKRIIDDPRNHLLLCGGEIAVNLNASVFVCENVMGSDSGEHKKYWDKLIAYLESHGYRTKKERYNVSELGIPQNRRRIILFAWKSKRLKNFDSKISIVKNKGLSATLLIPKRKIHNHEIEFIDKKSPDYKIAHAIGQGQKLCNVRGGPRAIHTWEIPEVFGKATSSEIEFLNSVMKLRRQIRRRNSGDADPVEIEVLINKFGNKANGLINKLLQKNYLRRVNGEFIDLKNTFNGKYKRLDLNSLSPTVDTRFGSHKNFLHPTEHRAFTVREAARIQGFDDSFIFSGPLNRQYEMIGNAVPPPLSVFIASVIKDKILPKL